MALEIILAAMGTFFLEDKLLHGPNCSLCWRNCIWLKGLLAFNYHNFSLLAVVNIFLMAFLRMVDASTEQLQHRHRPWPCFMLSLQVTSEKNPTTFLRSSTLEYSTPRFFVFDILGARLNCLPEHVVHSMQCVLWMKIRYFNGSYT